MNDNLSKATDMNVGRYISILMENRQEHTIMDIVVFMYTRKKRNEVLQFLIVQCTCV